MWYVRSLLCDAVVALIVCAGLGDVSSLFCDVGVASSVCVCGILAHCF